MITNKELHKSMDCNKCYYIGFQANSRFGIASGDLGFAYKTEELAISRFNELKESYENGDDGSALLDLCDFFEGEEFEVEVIDSKTFCVQEVDEHCNYIKFYVSELEFE